MPPNEDFGDMNLSSPKVTYVEPGTNGPIQPEEPLALFNRMALPVPKKIAFDTGPQINLPKLI